MTTDLRALAAEVREAIDSPDPKAHEAIARALGPDAKDAGEAWNELGGGLARRGNKALARRCFEASAAASPSSHKPFANLGSLALERGDAEEAVRNLEIAATLVPDNPRVLSKLGAALHAKGDPARAAAAFDRSARLSSEWGTLHNLGLCLAEIGDPAAAVDAFDRALDLEPEAYATILGRARALFALGRVEEARGALDRCARSVPPERAAIVELLELLMQSEAFSQAIALSVAALDRLPADEAILLVLVSALGARGELARAEPYLRRALPVAEGPGPLMHLARLHALRGERQAETALLREAAARFPARTEARTQLAIALATEGEAEGALEILRPLLEESPTPNALGVLAMTELAVGDAGRAMAAIRKAEELGAGPESFQTAIALLTTNYVDDMTPEEVADAHRRWAARAFPPASPRPAAPRPARARLRVGFVSPDFREHSVGKLIEPVLRRLDRERFDVLCFSTTVRAPDALTARIRSLPLTFRDLREKSITEMVAAIEIDEIDVLFDLDGWMSEQKLEVFHCRAAPTQVAYLGYPHTTGIANMDFRITDSVADPPGSEASYTEALVRLGRSAWAFETNAPASRLSHARSSPTFGSFNNLCKVTPTTLDLWSGVLGAVPGSRLLVKAQGLEHPLARRRLLDGLSLRGVDPSRVELRGPVASNAAHLDAYGEVDVALDTYPYNGTTTTCEALFAGVPVVTLTGRTPASRVGASLLGAAGLEGAIASSKDAYVAAAVSLAGVADDAARAEGRDRVAASALGDVAGLTRALEAAIIEMASRETA